MLYSGADLIRTSGQQAERLEKISAPAGVRPVANSAQGDEAKSNLDKSTQEALGRLIRFVHDKKEQKKGARRARKKGLPLAYLRQIEGILPELDDRGRSLDIIV